MSQDPYCYPGTTVLRNLFDCYDQEQLSDLESETSTIALGLFRLRSKPRVLDEARLKATHKAIFGEVYEWAGNYREGMAMMSKMRALGYRVVYGGSTFVPVEMARVFAELKAEKYLTSLKAETLAERLAYFYGEMDGTHPFREGNSRTLRQFFSDLAQSAGYELD